MTRHLSLTCYGREDNENRSSKNSDKKSLGCNHFPQVSHYNIPSPVMLMQSIVWRGRRMLVCSPPPLLTRPSASGMLRPPSSNTPSPVILVQSEAWRGRRMLVCLPPPLLTRPSASGML